MEATAIDPSRIRAAWQGRVSGCMLGKPVEVLSFQAGHAGLEAYLERADALSLRDYVLLVEGMVVDRLRRACRQWEFVRAEPDDDITEPTVDDVVDRTVAVAWTL